MITISDYIYERSVLEQLGIDTKQKSLFSKTADMANIEEDASGFYAEASSCLFFEEKTETRLKEGDLISLQRKLLCKGAELSSLRAEIIFLGVFKEDRLRSIAHSLGELCRSMKIDIRGINVHREASGEGIILHLHGKGKLKPQREVSWREDMMFPGQGIVITGSIGRAGSLKLFFENEDKMRRAFPKIFVDKMKNRVADRLPYLELESAPFFGVTALSYGEDGGLLAALYRLADREEAGLRIYSDRLFYDQETVEIAEFFNKNPLELSAEGVYVMAVARAEDFVESLRAAGLPAVLAGEVMEEKKRVIVFDEEERFIEGPRF